MNAFDILALGFTSIGCFIVGYFSGRQTNPKEVYDKVASVIKRRSTPVGTVARPSAEKVLLWSKPNEEEEQDAFKESFIKDVGDPTHVTKYEWKNT
jgi:hypothetical protein